jgi:DNA repair protein RadA/Sms
MAKNATQYVCQSCGTAYPRWSGRCDSCGAWNSLLEEQVSKGPSKHSLSPAALTTLGSVETKHLPRLATGIAEVDQVLGGGIVQGSVILLSGDPGIGKSTLVLQIAASLAKQRKVLYVSGEESASQIKLRADRLGLTADLSLLADTDIDGILPHVSDNFDLVIVDSIQTMTTSNLTGAAGTVGQITACASAIQSVAKKNHTAVLMIGHVTKDGNIAGPKILEHLVDVVLYLEGERYGSFKALRGIKNRFGSTSECGIFEMTGAGLAAVPNPSEALLAERLPSPGSVVLATVEGSRPLLVEVQALVSPTPFGYPKRAAVGFDLNRLGLLVAVLQKRTRLNLSSSDIYVNVVGGLKVIEPAADLAIILSIASAFGDIGVSHDIAAFGEVGLSGEVRSVSGAARRVEEAKRLGYKTVIGPSHRAVPGITAVATVTEAIAVLSDRAKTKSK